MARSALGKFATRGKTFRTGRSESRQNWPYRETRHDKAPTSDVPWTTRSGLARLGPGGHNLAPAVEHAFIFFHRPPLSERSKPNNEFAPVILTHTDN